MNCENCQELLSEFIDGELEEKVSSEIETHLSLCAECAELHEDFAGILLVCDKKDLTEDTTPTNPQAMWCRINNIIEAEIKSELAKEEKVQIEKSLVEKRRFWSFSFSQIAASIVGIAVISSVLTFVGLRNSSVTEVSSQASQPTLFEKALSKIGLAETPQQSRDRRMREQQVAIDYWNKRVESRRNQWDKNIREAFDRNLREVNQVVTEYHEILQTNPQDDLSGEMLDSAMREKMELLREFSEL